MKFAQEFKKSLQREGFPQKWIDSAIPYGQLKKCLKRVTSELQELGLDKDTLAQLIASESDSSGDICIHYDLADQTGESKHFRPRLTVLVHIEDGVAVDASLSPATKQFLSKIASSQGNNTPSLSKHAYENTRRSSNVSDIGDDFAPDSVPSDQVSSSVRRVEVPLIFDGEFFDLLQNDVSGLDALQQEEEAKMRKDIVTLGQTIAKVTKPSLTKSRKAKADLEKWRQIFELYLDAHVFFSTRESDHGARTSAQALDQLRWFQSEVLKRNLPQALKLPASREAFSRFLEVNGLLLQNLKFQEINRLAVAKILKKFDKQTALGVTRTFPGAIHSDHLLAGNMAKNLCAAVSSEIISVVPQLDDYLCPICLTIAYWPVRLECSHVFCTRCLVKMQRRHEGVCPLCRTKDVVMKANIYNIDHKLSDWLEKNFPNEVKEKLKTSERERMEEAYGPDFVDTSCSVM